MFNRNYNKPVRRNVTLNCFAAEYLERTSDVTGWTQGDIIGAALEQPIMQRLFAFTSPENDNPVTALIEAYQASRDITNWHVGESILYSVSKWLKKSAVPKTVSPNILEELNSYIHSHINHDGAAKIPFLRHVYVTTGYDMVNNKPMPERLMFVVQGEEMRDRLLEYIDTVMAGRDDRYLMGESMNFRNIGHILQECFEAPSEKELAWFYKEFSDGWVFPVKPS